MTGERLLVRPIAACLVKVPGSSSTHSGAKLVVLTGMTIA
jgi:hypothetical protein